MPHLRSRRAITGQLGAILFANPRNDELYWVKYLNPKSRSVVLARPDGAGQEDPLEIPEEPQRRCPHCGGTELLWLGKLTADEIADLTPPPSVELGGTRQNDD